MDGRRRGMNLGKGEDTLNETRSLVYRDMRTGNFSKGVCDLHAFADLLDPQLVHADVMASLAESISKVYLERGII